MATETPSFKIVMFPWLAHGHIFPFLELAKRILTKHNFYIYFCTTAVNFPSITAYIQSNLLEASIELIELHLQPHPDLPPHYHTTKNLPSKLVFSLIKAFQTARSSFARIVADLKPDQVIFDSFQPWAATIASSLSIPAVNFVIVGAATRSFNYYHYSCSDGEFPFPELVLQDYERRSQDNLMKFLYEHVFDRDRDIFFVNYRLSSEFVLVKTSRALEGKYIDYGSTVCNKKLLPVGPLITGTNINEEGNSDILQWLSLKDRNSTVYVSFGSEHFLSEGEIEEMANGLENSRVNFIWVIRFPVMEKRICLEEALPEGFLEKAKERGQVITGWAPQASILAHPSTGAFVSHCGWSSINESLYNGVPIIGMPVKINMFIDAKMLVHAGVCVEVVRDENGVYKRDEIAKAINEVMGEERGDAMRRRTKELGEKMRMEEEKAIGEMAEHLWQLCCKNKCK